jgi:hypothetical protein
MTIAASGPAPTVRAFAIAWGPKLLVSLVVALLLSLAVLSPNPLEAQKPSGAQADERQRGVRPLFVDGRSIGGPCSDDRSVAEASASGSPWCSLERAVAAAPSGSVVLVRGGDYPEFVVAGDGSRSEVVTFRPYGSEAVSVAGFRALGAGYHRGSLMGPVWAAA